MLFTPEALLIFSLHILSINSASSAVAAGFDLNLDDALSADSTNMFLDDKENMLAGNIGTGKSCRAEDMQLLPAVGRLRARQPRGSQSGKGKTCETEQQTPDETPDENPDENLTPFLEQLQKVEELAPPLVEGRSDICPPWEYAERDIPLCSSGNPRDEKSIPGDLGIILRNAIAYRGGCIKPEVLFCCDSFSLSEPGWNVGEIPGWGITGYNCLHGPGEQNAPRSF